MKIAYLIRNEKDTHTDSVLCVEGHTFDMLELPNKNNAPNISSIMDGRHPYFVDYSNNKKRNVTELREVPNRSQIQLHYAKDVSWLQGCIGYKKQEDEKIGHNLLGENGIIIVKTIK